MKLKVPGALLIGLAVALVGCAPSGLPDRAQPAGDGQARGAPKHLTFVVNDEPGPLITTLAGSGRKAAEDLANAVHQHLATYDDKGQALPMLATELPSVDNGTWLVRPDGTMQTTYKLHRNVTWHDGQPFTAKDVVLAWTVTRDPQIAMAVHVVADLIAGIQTPDDYTLVIEWSNTYPSANVLVEEDLSPMPVHILGALYSTDKERFRNSLYWTTEFVGLGPYRLAAWERGSHLTLQAYEHFHRGRANIDTITVRIISDESTIAANLLAGSVDGTKPTLTQGLFIKTEWERAGRSPLAVLQTSHWRVISVQFRVPNPQEITDIRVRRGLLHALDRPAMVEALFAGQAPVSEAFVPPDDFKWDWVRDVAPKSDYDPRRAQQLLSEVGWRRAPDGSLVDSAGRKVTMPAWTSSPDTEDELALIGNYWKALGLDVPQVVLTTPQRLDRRFSSQFPAFATTQASLNFRNLMFKTYGEACPTEETRWVGGNQGCYINPAFDGLVDAATVALDPNDQRRLYREIVTLQAAELPVLPLYFLVQMVLFREGVTGVKGDTKPPTGLMWNVAEWNLR